MAIIPAVRRERELGLIGETLFDYRDVLGAGEPTVLERAWRELAKLGVGLEVTALRGDESRRRWQSLSSVGVLQCADDAAKRSIGGGVCGGSQEISQGEPQAGS